MAELGERDGVSGVPGERIERYVNQCSDYDIVVDAEAYEQGRQLGLQTYCSRESGYMVGMQNETYRDVCLGTLRQGFLDAYSTGQAIYVAKAAMLSADNRIRAAENELRCLRQEVDGGEIRIGVVAVGTESAQSREAREAMEVVTDRLDRLAEEFSNAQAICQNMVGSHQENGYAVEASSCLITAGSEVSQSGFLGRLGQLQESGCVQ